TLVGHDSDREISERSCLGQDVQMPAVEDVEYAGGEYAHCGIKSYSGAPGMCVESHDCGDASSDSSTLTIGGDCSANSRCDRTTEPRFLLCATPGRSRMRMIYVTSMTPTATRWYDGLPLALGFALLLLLISY